MDCLNAADGSPLARPGILTLQFTQPRHLQLFSDGGDLMQLEMQSGTATLQVLPPALMVITPTPDDDYQLLKNNQALKTETARPGRYWLGSPFTQ